MESTPRTTRPTGEDPSPVLVDQGPFTREHNMYTYTGIMLEKDKKDLPGG